MELAFVGECELDGFAGFNAEVRDVEQCGFDGFRSFAMRGAQEVSGVYLPF